MKHFVVICCGQGGHPAQQMVAPRPRNRSFRQSPSRFAGAVPCGRMVRHSERAPKRPSEKLQPKLVTRPDRARHHLGRRAHLNAYVAADKAPL